MLISILVYVTYQTAAGYSYQTTAAYNNIVGNTYMMNSVNALPYFCVLSIR